MISGRFPADFRRFSRRSTQRPNRLSKPVRSYAFFSRLLLHNIMIMTNYIKEACVGNLQESLKAEEKGANRLELCANLEVGGTTPSEELILQARQLLNIPLRIMIRPRGGDFIYSEKELEEMKVSIEFCKKAGVEAVVFGILKPDNTLDLERMTELAQLAAPLKVVVHKAIDLTPDPVAAIEGLCRIEGIATVLTSGGKPTAFEGRETLTQMMQSCGKIEVMPGGKVSEDNVEALHRELGTTAYHGKLIVGSLE